MSLSNTALSAIQQAGAAVFTADLELKNAVRDYAVRVHAAMSANPYNLGNDDMFENWKVVARLSQTIAGIEEELKKIYHVAAELISDDQPLLVQISALAAPKASVEKPVSIEDALKPTDVIDKTKKSKSKPVSVVTKAIRKPALKTPAKSALSPQLVGGNTAKLMQYLNKILNTHEFTTFNQTSVSQQTGIPLGSMTAAVKRATELGIIKTGPTGGLKLAKPE
ncbi:MAG: hypothetical protein WCG50_14600 [Rhodoferax sp.]|uniref:hypothetical protein n=1 Tax=Rhodoferax sp. TaxID=50421 RepID=UPI003015FBD1